MAAPQLLDPFAVRASRAEQALKVHVICRAKCQQHMPCAVSLVVVSEQQEECSHPGGEGPCLALTECELLPR